MARQFTDDADGVELAQETFSGTSKLTLFAWVKLASLGSFQTIWARRTGANATFQFRVTDGNRLSLAWTHANNQFNGYSDNTAPLVNSTGVWFALGLSFDWETPASVTYYVDGTPTVRSRGNGSGTAPTNPDTPITLGRYASSGHPLKGELAFPARWNRVLSDAEHAQLAAGFHPKHIRNGLASLPDLERGIDLVTGAALTFTDAPALATNPRVYS